MKSLFKKAVENVRCLKEKIYTLILLCCARIRAAAEGKGCFFSVIIPVYNTEKYVTEAIESILGQSIGFKLTQIVLVDDGSSDGSAAICSEYEKKYPENIVFLHQENKGVSAARNLGLDHADGVYLVFLDSDDKWDRYAFYHTLKFLKKNRYPAVAAAKMRYFDRKTGAHPRNYLFEEDTIRDLERDFWAVPLSVSQSFFKASIVGDLRFLEGMRHSEDARFTTEVLLKTKSYGAMSKPTYLYRKRMDAGSPIDTIIQDLYYYTDALTEFHDYLIAESIRQAGSVPRFVQYTLAYNLGTRIRGQTAKMLGESSLKAYKDHLIRILQFVSDEVLCAQRLLDLYDKLYLVALKKGVPFKALMESIRCDANGRIVTNADSELIPVSTITEFDCKCIINFFHVDEEHQTLTLEGTLPALRGLPEQVRMEIACNQQSYAPLLYPRKHGKKNVCFDDAEIELYPLHFRAVLPLEDNMQISVWYTIGSAKDIPLTQMNLGFGRFAYLHAGFEKTNYAIKEGRVYRYRNQCLLIKKEEPDDREKFEKQLCSELLMTPKGQKWISYREFALAHQQGKPKLWLLTDRMTSAEDSGEEMFRYLLKHPVDNVDLAFVLRKDVPDYKRLSKIGKVLPFGSEDHLKAVLIADTIISSAGDIEIINPFGNDMKYIKDLLHFDFVFLQHGVIKDDLSGWLHRAIKNIRLFVTSSERERQAVLSDPYGYGEEQVILTGLPRFDKLARKGRAPREKSIYIMPTWRQWLAPVFDINAKTVEGIQTRRTGFRNSDYFRFYDSLLSDGRLHELLRKHDIHLYFALHPRMGAEMDSFYSDERVHLLKPESFVYGDAFKEMQMLITDYSSVAFNAAFLKKPVIYAQFDYDEFYCSGKHSSTVSYFSYEDDGFGPVVKTVDAVIDEIKNAIERSFEMDEIYAKRADDFFFRPEQGTTHCEMVLNEILKMKNRSISKTSGR